MMTHEQRAKKILSAWLLEIRGYSNGEIPEEVHKLFHHLKEAIKAELPEPPQPEGK